MAPVAARIQDYCGHETAGYAATVSVPGALMTFFRAFFIAVFFASFVGAFFAPLLFAAWNAAQRFFVASEIAFLPAALILRFGFAVTVLDGASDLPLDAAHRFR